MPLEYQIKEEVKPDGPWADSRRQAMMEGYEVQKLMKNPPKGFQVIWDKIKKRLDDLHSTITKRQGLPEDPTARLVEIQVRMEFYNELKFLLSFPEFIIEDAERAFDELKERNIDTGEIREKSDLNDKFMKR